MGKKQKGALEDVPALLSERQELHAQRKALEEQIKGLSDQIVTLMLKADTKTVLVAGFKATVVDDATQTTFSKDKLTIKLLEGGVDVDLINGAIAYATEVKPKVPYLNVVVVKQ